MLDTVHPDMFSKTIVRMNVKPDEVNKDFKSGARSIVVEVDVR